MRCRTLGLSAYKFPVPARLSSGRQEKVCSCPNIKLQDWGSVSVGWQLTQDTCAHKAQDPVQGHKIILIDKLRDAEQVKFISEARDEPNCGQTVCYRQGAKPGQTDK